MPPMAMPYLLSSSSRLLEPWSLSLVCVTRVLHGDLDANSVRITDVIGGVGLAAVKSDLSGNIAVCRLPMDKG